MPFKLWFDFDYAVSSRHEILWICLALYRRDISMFRCIVVPLPCGFPQQRRRPFKEPEVKSIWYLLHKYIFTVHTFNFQHTSCLSFHRDFSLASFFLLPFQFRCANVFQCLRTCSIWFADFFSSLFLNTNHSVRYRNVVIVVIFILHWNGPCKWYKS